MQRQCSNVCNHKRNLRWREESPGLRCRSAARYGQVANEHAASELILLSIRQEVLEVVRRAPPVTGRRSGAVRYGQAAAEHAASSFLCVLP